MKSLLAALRLARLRLHWDQFAKRVLPELLRVLRKDGVLVFACSPAASSPRGWRCME